MRARLHVRGSALGFFREGTHELCDARATRQLLPATLRRARSADGGDALARRRRACARSSSPRTSTRSRARRRTSTPARPLDAASLERLAATDGLTGVVSRVRSRHGSRT